MYVRFAVLAPVAAVLAFAAPARADGPWYVSGSVGGYFRESDNVSTTFSHSDNPTFKVPGTAGRSFDPTVIGNAAAGYAVIPQVRVEAEIGYFDYSGSTLNPLAHSPSFPRLNGSTFVRQSGNDWSRFTGTVNAFYDFLPIMGFTPYVGAGLGASADNKSTGIFIGPTGSKFIERGSAGTEGLVLAEGGVSFPLTDDLAVTASYRYVHFFDAGEDAAHIVKAGVRYSF
jgi:opacity protein-like surface antigen